MNRTHSRARARRRPVVLAGAVSAALSVALIAPAAAAAPGQPVATAASTAAVAASEIALTPNAVTDGKLPSGHKKIVFTLANGNWAKRIVLPQAPKDGDRVEIRSTSAYTSEVDGPLADLLTPLTISAGQTFVLTYRAPVGTWLVEGSTIQRLSPNSSGAVIPENPRPFTLYTLGDGDWAPRIDLPAVAKTGDVIVIRSAARWSSAIGTDNLRYASTVTIRTGDEYVLTYLVDTQLGLDKWVVTSAPTRTVTVASQLPDPTSPRMLTVLRDGVWAESVTLPARPGDRDRVTLRSDATWKSRVVGPVDTTVPLTLTKGTEYTLLFIAEKAQWVVLDSTVVTHRLGALPAGVLPKLTTPRTRVTAADGDWAAQLVLPAGSPVGSRVILETAAQWAVPVETSTGIERVQKGETAAFIVRPSGDWERETVTVDLLMLYSDAAAAKLGAAEMRSRLNEGLRLTNEALENSGANVRFRAVGLREFSAPKTWVTLNDALSALGTDAVAQQWRDEAKADIVYYEGTERGCGLGWVDVRRAPAVSTGSLDCGTTVMRHELGHNLGVAHSDSASMVRGYDAVSDVMGGNSVPFFTTPDRYVPATGVTLGIPGRIDAVKGINANAAAIAALR